MDTDLLALLSAQVVSGRTHSKPVGDLSAWKFHVLNNSFPEAKKDTPTKSKTQGMVRGFMALARMLGKRKK